jgi:hypothetical protein
LKGLDMSILKRSRGAPRAGFALTDLAATIAAILILIAILSTSLGESRRNAQLGESIANLKRIGAGTTSYAADHQDLLWGFSWQGGTVELMADENGDLVPTELPDDDNGAQMRQGVHLIRILDDRVGNEGTKLMPIVNAWAVQVMYSHLPLVDYLGAHPLDRWTADPGDRNRINWKDDPVNKFDQGFWLPNQPDPTIPTNRRWPYSSSYRAVAAAWDVYQSDLRNGTGFRVEQASTENTWIYPAEGQLFGNTLADVAYPAHKVHVHDSNQRHFGACQPFFAQLNSRLPLLFFDASVTVRRTADANPGWRPNIPTFPCSLYNYQGPLCPGDDTVVKGHYAWTRAGLSGLDFDALPVDTGQPDPGECDI